MMQMATMDQMVQGDSSPTRCKKARIDELCDEELRYVANLSEANHAINGDKCSYPKYGKRND